jgi:hypothetical protein
MNGVKKFHRGVEDAAVAVVVGVVVVHVVAVLADQGTGRVDLAERAAVVPEPHREQHRHIRQRAVVGEVAVRQQPRMAPRPVRQVPLVRHRAVEADQVDLAGPGQRGEQGVAGTGRVGVEGDEPGPPAAKRVLIHDGLHILTIKTD